MKMKSLDALNESRFVEGVAFDFERSDALAILSEFSEG